MCQITLPNWGSPAQQGWQCPVCRTVNAPWAAMCMGCPKPQVTLTSPSTAPVGPVVGQPYTTCDTALAEDAQLSLWNPLDTA